MGVGVSGGVAVATITGAVTFVKYPVLMKHPVPSSFTNSYMKILAFLLQNYLAVGIRVDGVVGVTLTGAVTFLIILS